ncbi:MAG: hypothetical protein BWY71_02045 [Planctomycetes bacterium ADurb.Bin412]|nr:MAG: hypothetical protein BWY71_02045 [Planctomycetes bacterium ADurb.Bin412]
MVRQPFVGLRVTVVEKPALPIPQQPFRMIHKQPTVFDHPLRLKPQNGLHALLVSMVTDGPQAVGKPLLVHFPGSQQVLPVVALIGIPAGIHPPVIQWNPLLQIPVDKLLLILLVGIDHFRKLMRTARRQLRLGELAARTGQIVFDHPAAPDILKPAAIRPLAKLQNHQGRADFLTRLQFQMRAFLPKDHVQRLPLIPFEFPGPHAVPTQSEDQTVFFPFQVEKGYIIGCGKTAPGGVILLHIRGQHRFRRMKIRRGSMCSLIIRQDKGILGLAGDIHIQGLDIFQNRAVLGTGVFQIHHPFHRRKIQIPDSLAADLQAGIGVRIFLDILFPPIPKIFRTSFYFESRNDIRKSLAVINKRKRCGNREAFFLFPDFQIPQPDLPPVLQRNLCLRPVRPVKRNIIAAVSRLQNEFFCSPQVHFHRDRLVAAPQHLRPELRLAVHRHRKNHAARPRRIIHPH